MLRNPAVDAYLARAPGFARPILKRLRSIVHKAVPSIGEELKWGAPTFMKEGRVCSILAFKEHAAIWFHKGSLLKDPKKLLQPGVKAKTMKTIRLTTPGEIDAGGIGALVRQAAALNGRGVKVKRAPIKVVVPSALRKALSKNKKARAFFSSLAPSHRRDYAQSIAEAKKPETVERRLKKVMSELSKGRRPNEKYR